MGIALLIIGLILGVACCGYLVFRVQKFCKSHVPGVEHPKVEGNEKIWLIGLVLAQGLFTIISSYGIMGVKGWTLSAGENVMLIFGSYIFGSAFALGLSSFILYYWRPDFDEKQRKISRILTFVAIPLLVGGLILFTEGFAHHIPLGEALPNGISFTEGLVRPGEGTGFTIKFYGILIVCGALFPLAITDHMFYKKYGAHNLADSLFIFAFLMGVVGARLWFCLVLEPEWYLAHPADILKITNGGMAIQGGALLGIIAGVSFVLIFRKYIDIRYAMDVAIPTILIAQCVGRWGNFFNQEVYGAALGTDALGFLPTIIRNNMFINGEYRVPLFLIEGAINLAGYFIIRYVCGKALKCHTGLGYQASLYLVWYGLVRVIMEPLRNSSFEYNQSYITAFVMMGAGVALFVMFFVIHKIRFDKKLENKYGDKI
ncbi:MAG: prolipoprotein diacylglyceryl transferase [Bacilli bacterium]|nr:prolipoprotein diacylglyceryl transferase [Bacilli bacterium]